jgi:hypothetical protein
MSNELKHSVAVMGLPLANVTADEAVDQIESLILSGGTHQVATANLDFWLNSLNDVHLHRIIAGCSLVLPDGMPLVWISRLLGNPLKERVSGAIWFRSWLSFRRARATASTYWADAMAWRNVPARCLQGNVSRREYCRPPCSSAGRSGAHGSRRCAGTDSGRKAGHSDGRVRQSQAGKVDSDACQAVRRAGLDRHRRQHGYAGGRCEARSRSGCSAAV